MVAPQHTGGGLMRRPPRRRQQQAAARPWKLSRWYCWVSAVGAALAILTSSSSSNSPESLIVNPSISAEDLAEKEFVDRTSSNSIFNWDVLFSGKPEPAAVVEKPSPLPPWLRWIQPNKEASAEKKKGISQPQTKSYIPKFVLWLLPFSLDPTILHPNADTVTGLIDKVLTSTLRLLLIANWLLALTILLHSAVADWFLGSDHATAASNTNNNNPARGAPGGAAAVDPWTTSNNGNSNSNNSRERMGGFLVFKLLLISAVVAPDTLDLLILLSWYTVLSFLRSLAALCAQQTESAAHYRSTSSLQRSGGPSGGGGVWKLLVAVLGADLTAAVVCVALFHGAGTGMVLLLTCDCALLAVDVLTHILQHLQLVWEMQHADAVEQIEEEQLVLHERRRRLGRRRSKSSRASLEEVKEEEEEDEDGEVLEASFESTTSTATDSTEDLSRELDRRMELLEEQHFRKSSCLESSIFSLQLFSDLLTISHFLHIWSLHGVQFTLIDGVLALHLHSAMSAASKKIIDRRNLNKIARDMDGTFDNATELDLRKAAAAGDVCCICLGTMSYYHRQANPKSGKNHHGSSSMNNVKKVACGHLYHTLCLREVVERARSMEAARCPLCRASIVHGVGGDGRHLHHSGGTAGLENMHAAAGLENMHAEGGDAVANREGNVDLPPVVAPPALGERALFRFTTENMFPVWLPLPAFSFEVVRRPAMAVMLPQRREAAAGGQVQNDDNNADNTDNNNAVRAAGRNNNNAVAQPSFLRRLLLVSGIVQMTAEEERTALEQLVEMFPQYDRQDLLAALRQRGSAESVAESILLGSFVGVPRGV